MTYNRQIRLRGRPWYQAARRVSLGYELDPAEHRGFRLVIPAYMVAEDAPHQSPSPMNLQLGALGVVGPVSARPSPATRASRELSTGGEPHCQ